MAALYILGGSTLLLVLVGFFGVLIWGLMFDLRSVQKSNDLIIDYLQTLDRGIVSELRRLTEGQRLSTVLSISPASLKIDPSVFEPKRSAVRERMLKEFETQNHPNPGTRAYCILDHSGWEKFVDAKTFLAAQNALGRLLVNDDKVAARSFVEELVDKL